MYKVNQWPNTTYSKSSFVESVALEMKILNISNWTLAKNVLKSRKMLLFHPVFWQHKTTQNDP
jgi:hypothetical protein